VLEPSQAPGLAGRCNYKDSHAWYTLTVPGIVDKIQEKRHFTITTNMVYDPEDNALIINRPAPNIPYFTPAQSPPSGTAILKDSEAAQLPKLFTPLHIRGLRFQNRIFVSTSPQVEALWVELNLSSIRSCHHCVNTLVKMDTSQIGTWHTWVASSLVGQD
jgi:hypothetical protein